MAACFVKRFHHPLGDFDAGPATYYGLFNFVEGHFQNSVCSESISSEKCSEAVVYRLSQPCLREISLLQPCDEEYPCFQSNAQGCSILMIAMMGRKTCLR